MHVDLVCLVARPDGTVLGTRADRDPGGRLASLAIELDEDERALPPARHAVLERFGLGSPVLEVHVPAEVEKLDPAPILIVFEPPAASWELPRELEWLPLDALDRDAIPEPIRPRALQWLTEAGGSQPIPSLRPAWSRPGWLARITSWLDATLAGAGCARTGPVEQMRLWGISALLRAETNRGVVWVKAAYPRFAAEPRITQFLAERFPEAVPCVLGSNEEEAWLALEDLGADEVGARRGDDVGREAVRLLVRMQLELAADAGSLLRAGAADRPLHRLADDLEAAFAEELPPVEWAQTRERRAQLVEQVRRDASDLTALGMPVTLVHGDFHAYNVAVVNGRPVIFDWTDAAVSHPLMDFASWVCYIEDKKARPILWQAWVEAWSDVVPASELAERFHQVLALGSAYQVVSYAAIVRTLEPASRPSLAHGASDFATLLDGAVAAREGAASGGSDG